MIYTSKASPAILVMPSDCHIDRVDAAPPFFELCAGEIVRRRRHQMIENDCVMFSPAELRQPRKIIAIIQFAREPSSAEFAQRSIDQFGCQKKGCGWQFRNMIESFGMQPRKEMHAQRRDDAGDPFIVL